MSVNNAFALIRKLAVEFKNDDITHLEFNFGVADALFMLQQNARKDVSEFYQDIKYIEEQSEKGFW
jgi:hypothetical protein